MTDTSTADLERQAEAARARVADTAESLRSKMTPGQMMEDVLKRVGILSSTLQDVRVGGELELDAIINAVIDVGRLTRVPTPSLEFGSACAGLLNQRIVQDGVAFAPAVVRKA